jgi:hypothetical protein
MAPAVHTDLAERAHDRYGGEVEGGSRGASVEIWSLNAVVHDIWRAGELVVVTPMRY